MSSDSSDYHIVPVDDLVKHLDSRECWCVPKIEDVGDGTMVTHHAADDREVGEALEDEAVRGADALTRQRYRRRPS